MYVVICCNIYETFTYYSGSNCSASCTYSGLSKAPIDCPGNMFTHTLNGVESSYVNQCSVEYWIVSNETISVVPRLGGEYHSGPV